MQKITNFTPSQKYAEHEEMYPFTDCTWHGAIFLCS